MMVLKLTHRGARESLLNRRQGPRESEGILKVAAVKLPGE